MPTPTTSEGTRWFAKRRRTIARSSSVLNAMARGRWKTRRYIASPMAGSSCAVGTRTARSGTIGRPNTVGQ
ncbi:MAG: hypothetical protein A3H36_00945 [Chloroflexi bacterium RIFCSPLOWO2_02_FULL_71_16]|nr:MAG: hypothetical protein A3H36_00945 [Chloroflexi bacterium RIFCSPLOWO2_02_FULL_71_16]